MDRAELTAMMSNRPARAMSRTPDDLWYFQPDKSRREQLADQVSRLDRAMGTDPYVADQAAPVVTGGPDTFLGMGVGDLLPGAGSVLSGADFLDAYDERDYLGMLLAGLGVGGAGFITKPARKGLGKAAGYIGDVLGHPKLPKKTAAAAMLGPVAAAGSEASPLEEAVEPTGEVPSAPGWRRKTYGEE